MMARPICILLFEFRKFRIVERCKEHHALLPDIPKPLPTPIEDEILRCVQLFEYLLRLSPVKKNVRLRSPEWVGSLRVFIATALHRRFDPVVVRGNIRCE